MRKFSPLPIAVVAVFLLGGVSIAVLLPGEHINSKAASPPIADIAKAFGIATTAQSQNTESTKKPQVVFYIDNSESMKGFVSDPGSTFIRVIQAVYQNIVIAQHPIRAVKVADSFKNLDRVLVNDFSQSWFFNGKDTRLADALSRMASDVSEKKVALLIGDFVQSEPGKDYGAVVQSLQEIAQKGAHILLLAFRSSFHGTYFVESGPKGKFQLDLKGGPQEGRPFYILVAAPSRNDLRLFQQYVVSGLGEAYRFEPTTAFVSISEKKWKLATTTPGKSKWRHGKGPMDFPESTLSAIFYEEFEMKPGVSADGFLRLEFAARSDLPIVSVERFRFDVTTQKFGGDQSKSNLVSSFFTGAQLSGLKLAVKPQAGIQESSNSGFQIPAGSEFSFRVTYPFSQNAQNVEVHRIQMRIGGANLGAPQWVSEWSTVSDLLPSHGKQTLNLAFLIDAMLKAISEESVVLDHIVWLRKN